MGKRMTTDEFIEKSKIIHSNKYDYSHVNYIDNNTPVIIICPIHGEFKQLPRVHLSGSECYRCGNEKRKEKKRSNNNSFIEKAIRKHGNKYDYSKVKYIDAHTKVCITCPKHGDFWQTPNDHLNIKGHGCPICGGCIKLTTKEFIEKAKIIHGDKYDYSKVTYINNHTKVCITCPKHGDFWQTPNNHLTNYGCKKCGIELTNIKNTNDVNYFIKMAKKVHGNKYDYSKSKYISSIIPLIIICSKHGEFLQTPNNHLNGYGCPKCGQSHNEKEVEELLKNNNIKFEYQKHFKWLLFQSLDFFLPDYNIAIECQGEQHFIPVNFSGNLTNSEQLNLLKKIKEQDKNKYFLCLKHNIKTLYYISNRTIKNGKIHEHKSDFYKDKFTTNNLNKLIKEIR